jgi:crotonobetainyl-CoA:carnitine CoA-transferase CaiB-like acyl-CoA transferase
MNSETGALSGVRVLEVGTLIAGPFAGRLLAEMGADVIKIEGPGQPDPMRAWGQGEYRGRHLGWPVQFRNKRLITLDLRRGRELFLDLVAESDVVLENFRPGTMEKWGIGFEDLSKVNPGIVMARAAELDRRLNDAGVVCWPVNTVAEVFDDAQLRARDMLVTHDDPDLGPFVGPGLAPKLSATPGALRWTGPWALGAHNTEVYSELLGLGPGDLARLADEGVI